MEGSCRYGQCLPPLVDVTVTRGPDIVCAILIVIISIIAFFGSCVFLSTLFRLRSRRISSHLFMASLIVSDLLVAVFSMPFAVFILLNDRTMPQSPDPTFNKYLQGFSHFVGRQASMGTMCLIVIDRFIAVRNPFRYKQVVTLKVAYICTGIVWLLAVLITLWPWFERLDPCVQNDPPSLKALHPYDFIQHGFLIYATWMPTCDWTPQKYGYAVFIPTFAVTLVLVFGLSIFLTIKLIVIRKTLKGKERNFRQATITTLFVALIFLFCYSVRHLYPLIQNACISCEAKGIIAAYMTCVIYLNSAANPIIYMLRGKILKREAAIMLSAVGQDFLNVVSGIAEEVSQQNIVIDRIKKTKSKDCIAIRPSECGFPRTPALDRRDSELHPGLFITEPSYLTLSPRPRKSSYDLAMRASPRLLCKISLVENGLAVEENFLTDHVVSNVDIEMDTLVEEREDEV